MNVCLWFPWKRLPCCERYVLKIICHGGVARGVMMFWWKLNLRHPPPSLSEPWCNLESPAKNDPTPRDAQGHSHRVFELAPQKTDTWFFSLFSISLAGVGGGVGQAGKSSGNILSFKPGLFLFLFDLVWFGWLHWQRGLWGAETNRDTLF